MLECTGFVMALIVHGVSGVPLTGVDGVSVLARRRESSGPSVGFLGATLTELLCF